MPLSLLEIMLLTENSYFKWNVINSRNRTRFARFTQEERETKGQFHEMYYKLRKKPKAFYRYTKMSVRTFDYIVENISDRISKNRPCSQLTTDQRLFITLRYFTTGEKISSLAPVFKMGASSIAKLLIETCNAILSELKNIHMGALTHDRLKQVRHDFFDLLQLPNCMGALDDMICKVRQPKDPQSDYFSDKKFCHIVLQGLADAHYKFLSVETIGKDKDGSTFCFSDLFHNLQNNEYCFSNRNDTSAELKKLPNFVYATCSYPLKNYVINPYQHRNINEEKQYLNNELLKAKYCIHSAFGLMCMKWKLLTETIESTDIDKCKVFLKTICLLHNIVRDMDGDADPAYIRVKKSKKEWNIYNSYQYGRRIRGNFGSRPRINRDAVCQFMWSLRDTKPAPAPVT